MATLSTQQITQGGTAMALSAAAAGGDNCSPGHRNFLHVKNGGGSPITVTLTVYGTGPGGNPSANRAVSVAAGADELIGPLPPDAYANPANQGQVSIGYSAVASVTVGCFSL